jgi:hypothetical protein
MRVTSTVDPKSEDIRKMLVNDFEEGRRMYDLTGVSDGTLCYIAKKSGCFNHLGKLNNYKVLDVLRRQWRTFVFERNVDWSSWQDSWKDFVAQIQQNKKGV